jgi:deoxyribodipyrimidine photo-lyase
MNRNHPDFESTSQLSPYLHFGHISSHEIFDQIIGKENWTMDRLFIKPTGGKAGWWGMSESAEAFLDQIITWRELGFNMCHLRKDYDQYESLPEWALKTLSDHIQDTRPYLYSLDQFEHSRTHDPLWNAAQRELVNTGRMHNYLRMLWGKKILEWSPKPKTALDIMIELNNKYALDGRDPNSYSGIFWILGRYDRAWGPERSIFGKIRYMSSDNTARKVKVKNYLEKYSS